jgi:hypothetical protein
MEAAKLSLSLEGIGVSSAKLHQRRRPTEKTA